MSQNPLPQPSRRDILRPVEMVVGALIGSLFVGAIVLLATREPILSVICFGIVFIVVLVALAMLSVTMKPREDELLDLEEQNGDGPHS